MNWISVNDRLPDNSKEMLVMDNFNRFWLAAYEHNHWEDTATYSRMSDITHWCEITYPEQP